MATTAGDVELTMEEVREVVRYAAACAEQVLVVFAHERPGDPRPAAALDAARAFADGARRSGLLRTAAAEARRAAAEASGEAAGAASGEATGEASGEAARNAATAAAHAAAAAYLRPSTQPSQVRHILGAGAHAARAAELARGDDPVVAEYVVTAAARRASPIVRDVLRRYPRAPGGRSRVAVLMRRLDSLLRDPPAPVREVDDEGPFFHGTRADLHPGDLLTPGWRSNYGTGRMANHVYLTASREGAPLAAELASGEGPPRVYRVEPLGAIEDDPNVTDKRFPGNPTRSYRTRGPVRVVEEVLDWRPPPADLVQRLRHRTRELAELGIEAMDD